MRFGKYRGTPIQALDDGYLAWLARQNWINADLREAVEAEITNRGEGTGHPRPRLESAPPDVVDELIQAGYRALAKKYHPDVGGDTERMQQINRAVDALRVSRVGRS